MRTELYLGDIDECVKCAGTQPEITTLTRDHVIPIKAGKDHRDLFSAVVVSRMNLVTICRLDHDSVDRDKMRTYRHSGVPGLIGIIANYPRSLNPHILEIQESQWKKLFEEVLLRINSLNGNTPALFKSDYLVAADLIDHHLNSWTKGNFSRVA